MTFRDKSQARSEAVVNRAILAAGEVADLRRAGDHMPYLPIIEAIEDAIAAERARCMAILELEGWRGWRSEVRLRIERGDAP